MGEREERREGEGRKEGRERGKKEGRERGKREEGREGRRGGKIREITNLNNVLKFSKVVIDTKSKF